MSKHNLRYRQIHLDFHTSPKIPEIGTAFDKEHWQKTLRDAHVDSITCFASCHHGQSYYNTEVGIKHPELDYDLLRAQFEACKEIDINVPIYLTAGVHNEMAERHPEWREISKEGTYQGWTSDILEPGFKMMCFNSPYVDHLCEQIEEVARLFPTCDGIFLDIITQGQCCCTSCMQVMEQEGLDPEKEADRIACSEIAMQRYFEMTTAAATKRDPDMPVFHNSGHISKGSNDRLKFFSHLELESLPTGGWGYDHFPMSAKYCANLPLDFLGMTGKFHTTWGEFGGFKHPNALRYECAAMLAFGSKCSVGDQLHPVGKLDDSTYRLIGEAYRDVSAKEAWCSDATSVTDIAFIASESLNDDPHARDSDSDIGAARLLLEGHFLFDVIDASMDVDTYKAIIVPDDIVIPDSLKTKLDAYLDQGGKLILSAQSGLDADNTPLFDLGATLEGESPYQPDYIVPAEHCRPDFCETPFVMYLKSKRLKVTTGTSLGDIHDPYFNRAYNHFSSHQHTPPTPEKSGFDAGVQTDSILYFAHPVFTHYKALGAVSYKQYVLKAIRSFIGDVETVKSNLPSTARIVLNDQAKDSRLVLHFLHATPISRGGKLQLSGGNLASDGGIEIIEDLIPLHGTEVTFRETRTITACTLQPEDTPLPYTQHDGRVSITVDSFTCHQMVVFDYE